MTEIITVGRDLAKNVLQVHEAHGAGRAVLRKRLRRAQVLEFFSHLRSCVGRWKPVAERIFGAARSASWAMMCG